MVRSQRFAASRCVIVSYFPDHFPSSELFIDAHSHCTVMQKLRHPNVVRLFDVIETPTHTMLVLEFLSGGMLDSSSIVVS